MESVELARLGVLTTMLLFPTFVASARAVDPTVTEAPAMSLNDTLPLTASQRAAISDHLRQCWRADPITSGSGLQVIITITTDRSGVIRRAVISPRDVARVNADPALRQFSERAVRTVMDPHCANLPLPQTMLGQRREFTLRFTL